ncbi:hypothetical protein HY375_04075, partial [Candidatus Berkelbacteria bacterium]|nr:hypothetical protein [Candidatus Berkelbacteria bacterium]
TNTTPKSFTVAAQLVAAGARQQEIVQHIYKTKPLSTLKLWGTVLSKIQEDRERRFIWSTVAAGDFKAFDAADSETGGVIDELLKTVPAIDFALLLSEKQGDLTGSLRGVSRQVNVADVAKLFGGGGHEMAAAFRIAGGSLADNESEIIDKIRAFQATRLTSPAPTPPESTGRFNLPDAGDTFRPDTPLTKPVPAEAPTPAIPSVASLDASAAVPPTPASSPQSLKERQAAL